MRSQASAGGLAVVKEEQQQQQQAWTEEEREGEDTEPEIKVEGVAGKPMETIPVDDKPESSLTSIKRTKRYTCTYHIYVHLLQLHTHRLHIAF